MNHKNILSFSFFANFVSFKPKNMPFEVTFHKEEVGLEAMLRYNYKFLPSYC
jgi:hypothetical protein